MELDLVSAHVVEVNLLLLELIIELLMMFAVDTDEAAPILKLFMTKLSKQLDDKHNC